MSNWYVIPKDSDIQHYGIKGRSGRKKKYTTEGVVSPTIRSGAESGIIALQRVKSSSEKKASGGMMDGIMPSKEFLEVTAMINGKKPMNRQRILTILRSMPDKQKKQLVAEIRKKNPNFFALTSTASNKKIGQNPSKKIGQNTSYKSASQLPRR